MSTADQTQLRGLQRVLARETNISDLLQYLSDEDPRPWLDLVGFVPTTTSREFKLARVGNRRDVKGTADIVLKDPEGGELLIELKLAHAFSQDQRERYEESTNGRLVLAGLAADATLVRTAKRWEYLKLATILQAWRSSISRDAASLAVTATAVIESWDKVISAVFEPSGSSRRRALYSVRHKFIARVVTRQIADRLTQRDWGSAATVTSGGGLAIVQAWVRIEGDRRRCLIAEVRWWEELRGGELRLGVDYWLPETKESRAEAWELANGMDASIRIDALRAHLAVVAPELAKLLTGLNSGRKDATCDWEEVVERGFESTSNPEGVAGNRRNNNPGFVGDGTQRFEAVSSVDFTNASAADLVDLIEASLIYLRDRLPPDEGGRE